ncbi:hypothetical protein BDF19DRAFT_426546 [Syncephalis fuscata]|nr:hypothetical protein BDF19DRAFT_426546 [Syncephalis fuscata]
MDTGWEAGAKKIFGIPLHPLGEIDFFSFVNSQSQDHETSKIEVRQRLAGIQLQLTISTILGSLFAYNLIRLAQKIRVQPHGFFYVCYFLPSFLGVGYAVRQ